MFSSSKTEFEGQIAAIRQHETKMKDFARVATDQLSVHLQESGLQGINELKSLLDEKTDTLISLVRQQEESMRDMKKKTPYDIAKEEFERNKRDLNPTVDQTSLYESNLQRREEDTCMWIFEIDEYKAWYKAPKSSLLWVSGGPGFGKSILMSTVIENLKAAHSEKDPV